MGEHDHDHAHSTVPADVALRVRALESALTAKGYIATATLDAIIDTYENRVGPRNGAAVVARAWSDTGFRQQLRDDASAAIAAMGFAGMEGTRLAVVENAPGLHNMVVCTLCSCYPWSLLGLPPAWYKSFAYRSRAVAEPRSVLAEFGVTLGEEIEVRVWDSTAELRYLVLPERPPGTGGLDEAALAALVTRNGMIGTALL